MRTVIFSLGALALGANAWTGPGQCEPDNCYRQVSSDKNLAGSKEFCPGWLSGSGYQSIPKEYNNCADEKKLSSACSCITYTSSTSTVYPTSTPSTTPVYPTTTPTYPTTTPSSSKEYPTSKPPTYTTSTVYHTTVYTVTSCKPEVTNCPGKGHVTTEVTSYTTVCPVYPTTTLETYKPAPPPPAPTTYPPAPPPPAGTGSYSAKPTPSSVVTAGAGKFAANLAVAAGAVAVALL